MGAPPAKIAEARALWEIALLHISLGAAAGALVADPRQAAAAGFRAAQLLARAYFRLMRAIFTGATIADRTDRPGEKTSLRDLYSDFETLAYRAIPKARHEDVRKRVRIAGHNYEDAMRDLVPEAEEDEEPYSDDPDLVEANKEFSPEEGDDYAANETDDRDWDDAKRIAIEELKEAERHLAEVREAEKQELADLHKRIAEITKEQKKAEQKDAYKAAKRRASERASDRLRDTDKSRARAKTGRRSKARGKIAGAAMRSAQQGARMEIDSLASRDPKSLGFVRVPYGPHPCGWCLMLASRGVLLYKSRASANAAWHDNCHCVAEPVFSRDYYFSSPTFAKNRALHMMWRDVTKGKNGKGALSAWRSHFETRYSAGNNITKVIADNARDHPKKSQEDR